MGGIGDINRTAKSEEDVVEVKMRNYVPRGGGGFGGGKGGTHDDVVAGLSSPLGSMTTRILPNAKAPHLSTTTTTLFLSSEKRGGKDDDVNDDVNDDDDDDGGKGEAKKRNWDLKRDVARRMEKLDRETKRAVAELARDEQQQQQQHE
tara:strand:- start:19 stop:462 length:444 start_codon:yes stop_codon:yes gene_type:complete